MVSATSVTASAQSGEPARVSETARTFEFNIPSKSRLAALADFTATTGIQVLHPGQQPVSGTSRAVSGTYTAQQALSQILGGSGLVYRFTSATNVTLTAPVAAAAPVTVTGAITGAEGATGASDGVVLDTINVEGESGGAAVAGAGSGEGGPPGRDLQGAQAGAGGFIASRSATATKMDVPLREIPQSISVVTREQLDDRGAQNFSDTVSYTPGVAVNPYGNDSRFDQVTIRGFNGTLTGMYRDGLRQPTVGFNGFRLEPYGIDRVDVLRGPTSTLYGLNDPGGLINFISKKPVLATFGEITAGFGSFNNKQIGFDINGVATKDGTLFYRLTGLLRDSDTQVDFVKDDRIYIAPAITWQPDASTKFTVLARYQKDKTGDTFQLLPADGTRYHSPYGRIPVSRFLGEPAAHFDTEQASVGYEFEHRFDGGWTVRQNLRYSHAETDYLTVYPTGVSYFTAPNLWRTAQQNNERTNLFAVDTQAQYDSDFSWGSNKLLFGIDYSNLSWTGEQYGGPLTFLANPLYLLFPVVGPVNPYAPVGYGSRIANLPNTLNRSLDVAQTGVYAQDMLKIDNHWVLTFGGRYDWVETKSLTQSPAFANVGAVASLFDLNFPSVFKSDANDQAFSGRVGLSYLFDNGLTPYVSYSTSFGVVPGFTQTSTPLVLPIIGAIPLNYSTQPVKPEKGKQYEAGIKFQAPNSKSYFLVSAYHLTKQDAVSYDSTDPLQQAYYQTGEIRVRGLEFEGAVDFDNGFKALAAYTYLDAKVTKDNPADLSTSIVGNEPERVPNHMASVWGDYTIQEGVFRGLGFGAGLRYVGETFGDRANTIRVPSYTVVDAALRYEYQNWKFSLTAKNLFNREYVATCSTISNLLGGTPYQSCSYGEGQRVTFTAAYRW